MRLCLSDFVWVAAAFAFFPANGIAEDEVLNDKIVHATLSHNDLSVVKVGTTGVTSLEFPYKIEAIDGYGFSATPGAGDEFQLTYAKGTNYFSVRALKPGAIGNLTVVLDQKLYSIFFKESSDPSFVNIFELPADNEPAQAVSEKRQPATPAQIAWLLDAVKNYGTLRTTDPEILHGIHVTEPGKKISLGNGIESTIRRVLEDDLIGSVAFEVEIDNRTNDDFAYDPQSLEIKGGEQTYDAVMEEAAGMVKAGSSETVYFVVNKSGAPQPEGLMADTEPRLSLKYGPKNASLTFDSPTGGYLPTATTVQSPTESPSPTLTQNRASNSDPRAAATPAKHAVAKKVGKKSDPKPEPDNAKDSLAKSQKPERKKLFGWL
jgi:hypothetical protein